MRVKHVSKGRRNGIQPQFKCNSEAERGQVVVAVAVHHRDDRDANGTRIERQQRQQQRRRRRRRRRPPLRLVMDIAVNGGTHLQRAALIG